MRIEVLDKGFVQLMRCADSDLDVVNAARVSFDKESDWESEYLDGSEPERTLSSRDTKLIHYLAREGHWSPFSHPQIRLRVKAPIFVRTQLFKHKVGAAENEVSRRYVDDPPEFYEPEVWRARPDKSIKQGSGDTLPSDLYLETDSWYGKLAEEYRTVCEDALFMYEAMIKGGVAPEQARSILPQSTYTSWVWTGSLAFFARVYNQRSDSHAQLEAQEYARAIGEIMKPLFPISWVALTGGKDA